MLWTGDFLRIAGFKRLLHDVLDRQTLQDFFATENMVTQMQ